MDVPIRVEDDTVLVGATPAAPAGAGLVRLDGADLLLDPTAPDDPPHLRVFDLDDALTAVELLHGTEVAAAAERVADGGPPEAVPVDALPEGGIVAVARELALLHWLELHSPDLLPTGLLDLGVGTAAAVLDDLLADSERADAADRLRRRAGLVVELSGWLRDAPSPPPSGLGALVDAAVTATAAVLPFDSPLHDALTHETELARAVHALGGVRPDWNLLTGMPGVGNRLVAGAVHAGRGDGDVVERRIASVDWLQVPRGVLDTAEGTVTWSLSDGATPTVTVAVRALPGGEPAAGLAFRLYGTALPLPIAAGGLRLAPGGTEYVGSATLHGPPVGALTLDVHDPAAARPPRLGEDRATAEGVRWAARAVTALRLAGPSGAADAAARGAVTQAARLFRRVAAGHPRPAQQELAARRQARCYALLRAILARTGDRELARFDARWGTPRGPVQEVDVVPPSLTGPGWAALPAENALGSAHEWRPS
jgi:hypothetical protein